jgi:hypothetical protein
VVGGGKPVVSRLIAQTGRRRIDLQHTDDAQYEEDHPDDAVSLEDILKLL